MALVWSKNEKAQEYNSTPEQRADILAEIERLDWISYGKAVDVPMSQGMAIKAIRKDIGGRPVGCAWNGVLWDRYGLLGLCTRYRPGDTLSYWLDFGIGVVSLCYTEPEPYPDVIEGVLQAILDQAKEQCESANHAGPEPFRDMEDEVLEEIFEDIEARDGP